MVENDMQKIEKNSSNWESMEEFKEDGSSHESVKKEIKITEKIIVALP